MTLRLPKHARIAVILAEVAICLFWARGASAERFRVPPVQVFFQASAIYQITRNDADFYPEAATFAKYFSNGGQATGRLGVLVEGVYLGALYEYWYASREITLSGVEYSDTLKYQTVGGELGYYYSSNSRVYWLFTASAQYPLLARVDSVSSGASTSYSGTKRPAFQARVASGIRCYSFFSLLLEAGYRWGNLEKLSSGSTDYLSEARDFSLTGPFLGVGIGFHF